MRRKVKNRHQPEADRVYDSEKLAKFINYIMWDGKKNAAEKVVYGALDIVKEKTGVENPLEVFETALKNAGPTLEVRSRRIGGANYQVPREVRPERRMALAFRWIIDAARAKKGLDMDKRLADEIISASKNEGSAVKKKDDTHRMADANKAFAHFAW
jgi:small subunit ribosomal protein S7